MKYSAYIKYIREGDRLIPFRVSVFSAMLLPEPMRAALGNIAELSNANAVHSRELRMSDLFAGHTQWCHEQVLEYEHK